MKIVDAANSLYLTLGQPDNISIPSIAAYYRNNIGELNNLLNISFEVDSSTLELIDSSDAEMGDKEFSIFNLLYEIKYYTRESRNFMGVGGVDQILSAESDGGKLSFVNRNTTAIQYIELRKQTNELLKKAINAYKQGKYSPQHIEGGDLTVCYEPPNYNVRNQF